MSLNILILFFVDAFLLKGLKKVHVCKWQLLEQLFRKQIRNHLCSGINLIKNGYTNHN